MTAEIQRMEFTFWWSPEGKHVVTILAYDYWKARAEFMQRYPQYAKYMGEVYMTKRATLDIERLEVLL